MERLILLIAIIAIIAVGVGAGWAHLILSVTQGDSWSPRAYVPQKPGDCFVPPQGDPLYDAHYAKEVNRYNCQALEDQANAHYTDSRTEAVQWQTSQGKIGVYLILGVVVVMLGLLILAVLRGG